MYRLIPFVLLSISTCVQSRAVAIDTKVTPPSTAVTDENPSVTISKRGIAPSPAAGAIFKTVRVNCITDKPGGEDLEDICNIDCYAHLCLERTYILQYMKASDHNDDVKAHREYSGQSAYPFKGSDQEMMDRGIHRAGFEYQSAEEVPFASTAQGGNGQTDPRYSVPDYEHQSVVAGVVLAAQRMQGGQITAAYGQATFGGISSPLQDGDWFELEYISNSDYCRAFSLWRSGHMTIEEKEEVCKKDGKGPKDPVNRVYIRSNQYTGKKTTDNPGAEFKPAIRGEGPFEYLSPHKQRRDEQAGAGTIVDNETEIEEGDENED